MKQADLASLMSKLISRKEPFALATVVKTEGPALGKPGFKVLISESGQLVYGTLGGACPESAIVPMARKAIKTGVPKTVKVYLEDVEKAVEGVVKSQTEDEIHVETNCGGTMEIYVEPYLPQQRLILVGQGGKDDVEDALVHFGRLLDFEVTVIDHSPVLSEEPDVLVKDVDYDIGKFKFQEDDSVVVLTKGARDVETLEKLQSLPIRYLGMMASKQRAEDDMRELRKRGVAEAFIGSIHSPVGADIGALTPSEIALSVMAEVIATKYGKSLPGKSLGQGKPVSLT